MPYQHPRHYESQPMQAVVVTCSDGRVTGYDEFLEQRLGITRADRIAIPGGPGNLVHHDNPSSLRDVLFLIDAHNLERVVLIQHADCGYYKLHLGLADEDAMAAQQDADLADAARLIREASGVSRIDTYRVGDTGAGMLFQPVDTP